MLEEIKKEYRNFFATGVFVLFSLFWVYISLFTHKEDDLHQLYSASYGLMSLVGAVFGLEISAKWGGIKSVMGKSILMFSLGLFAQEFGQLVYSYYTYFLLIEIPYPSIGDIGYFGSIPLYILGVLYLAKASGVKIGLKSAERQIVSVLVPICLLIFSYIFFLNGYEFDFSNILRILLDFGYPLGQAIYISLAILTYLLSRGILGGTMKNKIFLILLALVIQYICDYTFLYLVNINASYPGGPIDFMYLVSYYIMTMALIQLGTVAHRTKRAQ